jgi:excisionase family DNA binding protein
MIRLMTKSEVADQLQVSLRTVDRLRTTGNLKSLRVRGTVRFHPEDVRAFIDAQGEGGRS